MRKLLNSQGEAPPQGSASTPTELMAPSSPSIVLVRMMVPEALPVIRTPAELPDDCALQIALS